MAEMERDRLEHAKVGSWFLGPRAENFQILSDLFSRVLKDQQQARATIYPSDPAFITGAMMETSSFKEAIVQLEEGVAELSSNLATHSIPFWSPRYNAHMNMDTALPSIIGCASPPYALTAPRP